MCQKDIHVSIVLTYSVIDLGQILNGDTNFQVTGLRFKGSRINRRIYAILVIIGQVSGILIRKEKKTSFSIQCTLYIPLDLAMH